MHWDVLHVQSNVVMCVASNIAQELIKLSDRACGPGQDKIVGQEDERYEDPSCSARIYPWSGYSKNRWKVSSAVDLAKRSKNRLHDKRS